VGDYSFNRPRRETGWSLRHGPFSIDEEHTFNGVNLPDIAVMSDQGIVGSGSAWFSYEDIETGIVNRSSQAVLRSEELDNLQNRAAPNLQAALKPRPWFGLRVEKRRKLLEIVDCEHQLIS